MTSIDLKLNLLLFHLFYHIENVKTVLGLFQKVFSQCYYFVFRLLIFDGTRSLRILLSYSYKGNKTVEAQKDILELQIEKN